MLQAVRKIGQMLLELDRQTHKPAAGAGSDPTAYRKALEENKIAERTAQTWQNIARIPETDCPENGQIAGQPGKEGKQSCLYFISANKTFSGT